MSDSHNCAFKYRNGSKSFRLNVRFYPSESLQTEELNAKFAKLIRAALDASLTV